MWEFFGWKLPLGELSRGRLPGGGANFPGGNCGGGKELSDYVIFHSNDLRANHYGVRRMRVLHLPFPITSTNSN